MALINKRIHKRVLDKKKRLDSLRPLLPTLAMRLKEQMAIEYTYNSNAIEGNTLTLRETRLVIEEGITVGGKSIAEILEAKNHPEAIKFVENLVVARSEIDEDAVLRIHRLVMLNIAEDAGRYRTTGVRITGAVFTPPPSSEVRLRMNELLKWLRENPDEYTPIELAAVFHHGFVQIHPFTEGNGRTARLLMNAILLKTGYPFIAIVPKRDRAKYLKTLMEADLRDASAFVNFVARCVERALDMYLDALEEPEILTLAEASKITPYSQEYLSLLARKGALGAFKQGRNWVITRRDLDRYLKSLAKSREKPDRLGDRKP
ncbi:Fic family protein [Candidatus Bathyarchaeota archaeon]|nr:MAG: Fic family protein [Candidatus Bathyarchaeota archaeon]